MTLDRADTIVVGGGLAGVSSLFALARRGIDALLVERRDGLALETSFANGGMLTPSSSDPWSSPGVGQHLLSSLLDPAAALKLHPMALPGLLPWGLRFLRNATPARHAAAARASYRLAAWSTGLTRDLVMRHEMPINSLSNGTLKLFATPAAEAASKRLVDMLESEGLRVARLSGNEAAELEPGLALSRNKIAGAFHFPDDMSGDAHLFTRKLAQQAQGMGARIRTGVPATRVALDRGRVVGVDTTEGRIAARRVVLAGGGATVSLARKVGVRLWITPAKGYSITFNMAGDVPQLRIPVIDDSMHIAVVPLGAQLRLVGTAEFAGPDTSLSALRLANLHRTFARLFPDHAAKLDAASGKAWAGLRPMSADGLPYIGPTAIDGLMINAGHGYLGWTLAVGAGELLADLILGAPPALDPTPYRVGR
jgi:D-amino-acid dehydrogenase